MSNFPHQYGTVSQGAQDLEIPQSLLSSRVAKAVPTLNRIISIPSASGSALQSGTLNFYIPGGNNSSGFLRAGSLYLRATVTVDKVAQAGDSVVFANQVNSAASIINRLSISSGGTNIETISRYDNYHAMILSTALNKNYYENDASITEYCGTSVDPVVGATSAVFNIALPLCSAVLSNIKSYPLFLQSLSVQIDLNTLRSSFKVYGANAGANTLTGFTVSQAELVYETISPDHSLLDTMRQEMQATGRMYEMPMTTPLSLQTSLLANQSLNYNIGLNAASLSGVFVCEITTERENLAFVNAAGGILGITNNFVRNTTEVQANRRLVFCDGKQLVNYDVWADSQNFNETQRALSILLDPSNTTLGTRATMCTPENNTQRYYVSGQSSRRFSENSVCMSGIPCSNLVINFQKGGASVSTSVYIYCLIDQVVVIDASGSVAVAK